MSASIRVGANAVIIRHGQILLVEFNDDSGRHYNLPGGGVRRGESLYRALRREVREETCAEVRPGRLLLVYEYLPRADEEARDPDAATHKVGLIFRCELLPGSQPRMPAKPDANQTGVDWLPLGELVDAPLLPTVADLIIEALDAPRAFDPFCDNV